MWGRAFQKLTWWILRNWLEISDWSVTCLFLFRLLCSILSIPNLLGRRFQNETSFVSASLSITVFMFLRSFIQHFSVFLGERCDDIVCASTLLISNVWVLIDKDRPFLTWPILTILDFTNFEQLWTDQLCATFARLTMRLETHKSDQRPFWNALFAKVAWVRSELENIS